MLLSGILVFPPVFAFLVLMWCFADWSFYFSKVSSLCHVSFFEFNHTWNYCPESYFSFLLFLLPFYCKLLSIHTVAIYIPSSHIIGEKECYCRKGVKSSLHFLKNFSRHDLPGWTWTQVPCLSLIYPNLTLKADRAWR